MAIQSVTGFDLAAHRQFCDDVDYLNSIWDWVLEEYPDNHIAAYGGRIVAVSKTQGGILAELKRQGIPQNFTVHRYASSKSEIWILQVAVRGYYRRDRRDQPLAPLVRAQLAIPVLGWVGEAEFLLDTGADVTTLLPKAVTDLGIDIRSLNSPVTRVHGIGGHVSCKYAEAHISLFDDSGSGGFREFPLRLVLIEGEPTEADGAQEPLSAVIGRDILNLCECTFNAVAGRVTLEPLG